MKHEASRIRDQRSDVKVSPEAFQRLKEVKAVLEKARPGERFGMSDVILMMYRWSGSSLTEIEKNGARTKELTTVEGSPSWIH